jgi:hypothetical protein
MVDLVGIDLQLLQVGTLGETVQVVEMDLQLQHTAKVKHGILCGSGK